MSWSNQFGSVEYDEFMHPVTTTHSHKRSRIQRDAPSTSLIQHSQTYTTNAAKNFDVDQKVFQQQYAAIYFIRLTMMRNVVREVALKLIDAEEKQTGIRPHLCSNILDVTESTDSIICGTLYKDMPLKPCILDEYSKAKSAGSSSHVGTYMSPTDQLILEDEYGRITLISSDDQPLNVGKWISGVVVGVRGVMVAGGKFQVKQIIEPGLPVQEVPRAVPPASSPDRYIMFVSGLSIGRPGLDPLPAQLLIDYIVGQLGSSAEQSALQSRIVRVVLCGNLLHRWDIKKQKDKGKDDPIEEIDAPLKELDLLLTQLAASVDIDLMPGADDPSNFNLPQAPLHKCLFPSASTYSTFHSHQNPAMLDLEGTRILAHAGQPINDMLKYVEAESPIELLSSTLRWRNMAPTAPDTLGCYPYADKDPFLLKECPHLYVAANQTQYQTQVVQGSQGQLCRLLCVPSFAETGTVVMFNLKDASTHPMQFVVRTK